MPNGKDQASDLYSAILSSAATIAFISASLYYIGYLYLLGFYRAFGIPIDSLNLSFQVIASQSRIILIPVIMIILFIYLDYKADDFKVNIPLGSIDVQIGLNSNIGRLLKGLKSLKFLLLPGALLLILIFSLILPQFGEHQANIEINNLKTEVDYLIFLESPLPKVIVYSTEVLPFLGQYVIDNSTKNSTYIYQNLRLVTSTDKNFYLFSKRNETYQLPREKVILVYFR